ncbi:formate dehydrogenase [Campylobacter blaseri]|uniref:Formate dehydrogenase n=3 Tax=Campylobacter blaseri TaxID=2042961 RepID=A0A2P8R427_9BACT|nr:formate dehydrogenase [Campylobacter blaseri]PSM54733.1 formate dehydrogenase [Campylobacter blaseri]
MTNHFGDMEANSKVILFIGANSAVANPVGGMKHALRARDRNNAKIVVVDPVFTRTAAKADMFIRIRPGTDIAFVYGMLHLIFKNGWEDKEVIKNQSYGIDEIRQEAKHWTPEEVANVTGCKEEELISFTRLFATTKPATLCWALGITQHSVGSSNTRILSILQLVLGNMGKPGGGCNIIRGHDNVQGSTDMGNLADTLPMYYGLADSAWKHYCKGWGVDFDEFVKRFAVSTKEKRDKVGEKVKGTNFNEYFYHDPKNPEDRNWRNEKGYSLAKWWQGVLKEENTFSSGNLRVLWVQGTGITSMAHTTKIQEAVDKLDMLVVAEPFLNEVAILSDRKDGIYVLPVCTQFESEGYVTATNRSAQWRTQVIKPIYESKEDQEVMFLFAKKFGFYDELVKGMMLDVVDGEIKQVKNEFVWPDDATDEIARVGQSIGNVGRTAKRLKRHQENWHNFDPVTLMGRGPVESEYYGLPWPCWDKEHPGSPILYDITIPYEKGGMGFRNRFGLEHNGVSQLADESVTLAGAKIKGGYPQITKDNIEKVLGITLTEEEKTKIGSSWSMDYSGTILKKCREFGITPYGNARARAIVWEFPDPIPKHREPLHSPRWDLVEKYPTYDDQERNFRVASKFISEQTEKDWSKEFPTVMSSLRLVNLSGAGMIERTSKYLASITPEMFAHVNPKLAANYGIEDGAMMWIHAPQGTKIKVKCIYSESVTPDRICLPYNFAGVMQGVDLSSRYPEGTKPYTIGESSNTVTNYGFDIITQISEYNAGLCRLERA